MIKLIIDLAWAFRETKHCRRTIHVGTRNSLVGGPWECTFLPLASLLATAVPLKFVRIADAGLDCPSLAISPVIAAVLSLVNIDVARAFHAMLIGRLVSRTFRNKALEICASDFTYLWFPNFVNRYLK